MASNFLFLAVGLMVLVVSANTFINGSAAIAKNMGVSPLLIGLTIVGLGTSAPEILVSAIASWEGNSGLAVGNAIGSNIANIGLILGCTALVAPLAFQSALLKRELPFLAGISLLCYILAFDGLSWSDSLTLLAALVMFLVWLIRTASRDVALGDKDDFEQEVEAGLPRKMPNWQAWFFCVVGLVGLLGSSKLLVWAAVDIAVFFGVSDLIIGLTIVALGTSLPELAASVVSVLKKEDDLAVGNVIGSNIYNLLAVYSLPGMIAPGAVAESVLIRDFPVMLGFTGVLFVLGYSFSGAGRINRYEGAALVLGYGGYQWWVYQTAVTLP